MMVLHKEIRYAGGTIPFPDATKLFRQDDYTPDEISQWKEVADTDRVIKNEAFVLNQQTYSQLFNKYACDNEKETLSDELGEIEASAGNVLEMNVTGDLGLDQWARIMAHCKEYNVLLSVHCAPGVVLPSKFFLEEFSTAETREPRAWATASLLNDAIITSTDADTTIAQLITSERAHHEFNPIVIDVSECKPSDLLTNMSSSFDKDQQQFSFSEKNQVVLEALEQGKDVVLKGMFSKELTDALASLLLARKKEGTSGRLFLIGEDMRSFQYAEQGYQHTVTIEEKLACLNIEADHPVAKLLDTHLEKESLSQLRSRKQFIEKHPGEASEKCWEGLKDLTRGIQGLGAFTPKTSLTETHLFMNQRREAVLDALKDSPYVFLTGLSGVGKSTFVMQELCGKEGCYVGAEQIENWIDNPAGTDPNILFLDEANLSPSQWSQFEGLFNDPPGLLLNGEYHLLDPKKHKVVFAGNPANYGDERHLAPFFVRHGKALVFDPLPLNVVYQRILKPALQDFIESEQETISRHILKVYETLCQYSTKEVIISPRELQMMALMIQSYQQAHPEVPLDKIIQKMVYDLAVPLVPKDKLAEFQREYPMPVELSTLRVEPSIQGKKGDFHFTESRRPLFDHLVNLLELRKFRQKATSDAQKYGGLGGLIVEGPPGVGKSDFVVQTLLLQGFYEGDPQSLKNKKPTFYRMPVSLDDKKAFLMKAFHEGAVVIIDEINSSPMMEDFLNDLLMGQSPDKKRPENPGFMVIGTQNPINMAGRRAASTALSRRMTSITLGDYPQKEIKEILQKKGLSDEQSTPPIQK